MTQESKSTRMSIRLFSAREYTIIHKGIQQQVQPIGCHTTIIIIEEQKRQNLPAKIGSLHHMHEMDLDNLFIKKSNLEKIG